MATISLYAGKVNQMPELINAAKKSVEKFKTELSDLQKKASKVDSSICNLSEVISSIQASTQTQENRIEALENFRKNSEEFVSETVRIDGKVADTVNQNKKDFYEEYSYLKPDCEKSFLEHLKDAAEWCKDHWREILIVLELVVAVVCLCVPGLQGFGVLILENMLKGLLVGLVMGGIVGGLAGYAKYGVDGILPGMFQGAVNGALTGAAFGGLGGFGGIAGKIFGCSEFMAGVFTVSSTLSLGMLAFDSIALLYDVQTRFEKDTGINLRLVPEAGRVISELNKSAHENSWYNAFQLVVGGTAAFSKGYIQNSTCFVAGTLVATVDGLKTIETIKAGDLVLSADIETMQTAYKPVLETYVRKVDRLVQLTVNSELITTTEDHPFFVYGKGFVNAVDLYKGYELIDKNENALVIEQIFREDLHDKTVDVYNFKVSQSHTYYVGVSSVLVHNANYPSNREKYMGKTPSKKSKVGQEVIDKMRSEGRIREGAEGLEFKAGDGNWYSVDRADMAHIKDAVSWWNEEGRNYGAKSPEVRAFMKDPNNYELELDSINRSQGPHNQTYLPPNK